MGASGLQLTQMCHLCDQHWLTLCAPNYEHNNMTSTQHNNDNDKLSRSNTAGTAAELLSPALDAGLGPSHSLAGWLPLHNPVPTAREHTACMASMASPSRGRPTLGSVTADPRLGLDHPFGHTHPYYGR